MSSRLLLWCWALTVAAAVGLLIAHLQHVRERPKPSAHVPSGVDASVATLSNSADIAGNADSVPPVLRDAGSTFADLYPLRVRTIMSAKSDSLRLYRADGKIDPQALASFNAIAGDGPGRHVATLSPRLVQLVFKAAYHFVANEVVIVSAYRPRMGGDTGKHTHAEAIDFKLEPEVTAAALAKYLRTQPRAGVGFYTHPETQYVHLDVRETSFTWNDPSGPKATRREENLPIDPTALKRDATWQKDQDLPESVVSH